MNNLSAIRKEKGISQEALAKMVGTDQSHISRIEKSHIEPGVNLAYSIARALDTTVEELFGGVVAGSEEAPHG